MRWLFAQRTEGPNLPDTAKEGWWVQEYRTQQRWLSDITKRMHAEVMRRARGHRLPTGFSFRASIDRPILGDGVYWGQPLMQTKAGLALLKRVSALSRITGWSQDDVVSLILLGVTPREDPRFRIEFGIPEEQGVLNKGEFPHWLDRPDLWARVSTDAGLRPWHLHRVSLEAIGSRLRAALHEFVGRSSKGQADDLPVRDQFLLDAVVTVGRLPPRGRGRGTDVGRNAYWDELAHVWTGRPVKPNALRMRWDRLLRRRRNVLDMLLTILQGGEGDE